MLYIAVHDIGRGSGNRNGRPRRLRVNPEGDHILFGIRNFLARIVGGRKYYGVYAVGKRGSVSLSVIGKQYCPADVLAAFSFYKSEVARRTRTVVVNPVLETAGSVVNIAGTYKGIGTGADFDIGNLVRNVSPEFRYAAVIVNRRKRERISVACPAKQQGLPFGAGLCPPALVHLAFVDNGGSVRVNARIINAVVYLVVQIAKGDYGRLHVLYKVNPCRAFFSAFVRCPQGKHVLAFGKGRKRGFRYNSARFCHFACLYPEVYGNFAVGIFGYRVYMLSFHKGGRQRGRRGVNRNRSRIVKVNAGHWF